MKDNLFNSVLVKKPNKNWFDLSHSHTCPLNIGELRPILATELYPSDKFVMSEEHILKSLPMNAPTMNEFDYYVHFFAVPCRLLDTPDHPMFEAEDWHTPQVPSDYYTYNNSRFPRLKKLLDALGYPQHIEEGETCTSYYFDAYSKIYNDWYRNEFTQEELLYLYDGYTFFDMISFGHYGIQYRNALKDLFTTLLPEPVMYGKDIVLSLGGVDSMYSLGEGVLPNVLNDVEINSLYNTSVSGYPTLKLTNNTINAGKGIINISSDLESDVDLQFTKFNLENQSTSTSSTTGPFSLTHSSLNIGKFAFNDFKLEGANIGTINELRTLFKAQEYLERKVLGGNRYIEQIYSMYGVRSSDARQQRSEYIGGGRSSVVFQQINSNNAPTETQALGEMAGHANSYGSSNKFSYYAEEHCILMAIASVIPKNYYMLTGNQRKFQRYEQLDFYWPQFGHIGQQAVKAHEIYDLEDSTYPNDIIGYQSAYSELKFIPSTVSPDFPSDLSSWIWYHNFKTLSDIEINPDDFSNLFFDQSDDSVQFILHSHLNIHAQRPMPLYGTPML